MEERLQKFLANAGIASRRKCEELILEGKTNRVVGYQDGHYIDFDINDALKMNKEIPEYQLDIAKIL